MREVGRKLEPGYLLDRVLPGRSVACGALRIVHRSAALGVLEERGVAGGEHPAGERDGGDGPALAAPSTHSRRGSVSSR